MESRQHRKSRVNPTQAESQEFVLEDGTSKAPSVGKDRILSIEEKLLLKKELCTLQVVMDVVILLSCGIRHQKLGTDSLYSFSQQWELYI